MLLFNSSDTTICDPFLDLLHFWEGRSNRISCFPWLTSETDFSASGLAFSQRPLHLSWLTDMEESSFWMLVEATSPEGRQKVVGELHDSAALHAQGLLVIKANGAKPLSSVVKVMYWRVQYVLFPLRVSWWHRSCSSHGRPRMYDCYKGTFGPAAHVQPAAKGECRAGNTSLI